MDPQQQKQLLAESKCNNVSFMKLEPLPSDCRSVLAVSDAYICYAVTQKRNLLRVIDSQTGEKSLLRGHQHCVTDLSFSPVDVHCICSVDAADGAPPIGADAGAGGAADHVFFWRKAAEGEWERRASLPLQAHRTVPHPARSNWWALLSHSGSSSDSGNSSVCVVDVDALASGDAAGSTLKMQLSAGERATDVAFSSDGAQLVVGIASRSSSGASSHRVQLYSFVPSLVGKAATDTDESSMGRRQLVPVYSASQATQMVLATGPESALLGLQCLPQDHLLTVTSSCSRSAGIGGASDSATAVSYVLTVWRCPFSQISAAAARDAGASTRMYPLPYVVQSLTLDLPRFSGGSGGSGSDGGGALSMHDCALCLEPRRQRYVVLTSR